MASLVYHFGYEYVNFNNVGSNSKNTIYTDDKLEDEEELFSEEDGRIENNDKIDKKEGNMKKGYSLMSILKWRRRRMRGHKYKKRMKKLRRKAK